MPDPTIAAALADLDRAVCAQFTNGLHHGISIGRMSAAAALDYAGHTEAAALVRAMDTPADDRAANVARIRHMADEMEWANNLLERGRQGLWFPMLARSEAERLEANPA